ncbi:MAG TPA: hypothetical protein VKA68_09500 [bacterium]|nr:hypothetical protein [bacterium]
MNRNGNSTAVIILGSLLFLTGCGTSGPPGFDGRPIIKPLDQYESPMTRDVAHLLYPAFQEIQREIAARYSDHSLRFMSYGLQVIRIDKESVHKSGFYIRLEFTVTDRLDTRQSFLQQAQQVGTRYIHPALVALSSDWDRVFSPGIAGSMLIFHWKASTVNQLMCLLETQDTRNYLNAEMTLQELIDRNWVEGKHGEQNLGRIELNALEMEPI